MGEAARAIDEVSRADVAHAEALLSDLASELRRAPLASSLRLHVRALDMKRAVAAWNTDLPTVEERRATMEEIIGLQRDVERLRRHADWRARLAV
jgi:hypothetical protein